MVNAALKSGNPSLGVGAGNGAVYVDATANIDRAVEDLLLSKRFDNGMICATENSAVIAQAVPLDRIMIETDSPYMAPVPHRGKRNDSGYVRHVCEKLAELKGVSFEACARITLENGKRFYGIP